MSWHYFWNALWMFPGTLYGLFLWATQQARFAKWAYGAPLFIAKPGSVLLWFFERFRFGGFSTGSMVFYPQDWYLNHKSSIAHELYHCHQAMKWGPLWYPAYLWASVVAQFKYWGKKDGGYSPSYWWNKYEVEARAHEHEESRPF